jgi:NAD(P)-dependent dehydrogenase (short-subunit alcohol dehydrogenase family)
MSALLDGKRIIVTGGSRGIGAATARALAGAGARVTVFDVDDDLGNQMVAATGSDRLTYRRCDITKRDAVNQAFDQAVAEMGGLDGLANVAGVERAEPAEIIDDDHWDFNLDVNARGTMHTNQAAFRHLRERGGRIVNFGSIAGVQGQRGSAAYSASKGAVLGWSRAVAREWGRYGITVNCVAPIIWSPMYDEYLSRMTEEERASRMAIREATIPLGARYGDADTDFAPVMVFLMSEWSRFITGQTLPVDGGMMILT